MAKLIFKTAKLQEPKVKALNEKQDERSALNIAIDAYAKASKTNADIDAQIKALQAKKVDMVKLEEAVIFEAMPLYAEQFAEKDKEFFVESTANKLKVGKMGTKREILDRKFIFNKLKKDAFIEAVTIPLGVVDKYLTEDEKKQCIESSDTKRNLSFVGPSEAAKMEE